MLAIHAPNFKNIPDAREWANRQSLSEAFYLVKIDYYHDFTLYEFWGLEEINLDGGLAAFDVVEVWE